MSEQNDDAGLGSTNEHGLTAPTQPRYRSILSPAEMVQFREQLAADIRARSMGPSITSDGNPRQSPLTHQQPTTRMFQPSQPRRLPSATITQPPAGSSAAASVASSNAFIDQQFRYSGNYNPGVRLQQPNQLRGTRPTATATAIGPSTPVRPGPSTSGQRMTPPQLAHPNILRPVSFRPRLPITPEVLDGLIKAQAQGRSYPVPTPLKRQASTSGERPAKRLATDPLKLIPYPSEVFWNDEKETHFTCPLCFEQFKEPHITQCGHTFCLACIERSFLLNSKCPICNGEVTRDNIIPNRVIHQLIRKYTEIEKGIAGDVHVAAKEAVENGNIEDLDVQSFLQKKYNELNLGEVDLLLSMLGRKKEILSNESEECRRTLMHDFLSELQQLKQAELNRVLEELSHINSDLSTVAPKKPETTKVIDPPISTNSIDNQKSTVESPPLAEGQQQSELSTSSGLKSDKVSSGAKSKDHFNATEIDAIHMQPSMAQRKLKVHSHFDVLSTMYLQSCQGRPSSLDVTVPEIGKTKNNIHFENFSNALDRISRYTSFRLLGTLQYNTDTLLNANIVSTIEFDKDKDFFAIGGVTKRIRLFDYGSVLAATVTMLTSNGEITCSSKISCLSYSRFYKNKLASSDYEGKVNVYDTSTCELISSLTEHEKRVWSVDFSDSDPRFLISGSDDCKVKLWSLTQQNSATTLHTNANVCCVKFVPGSPYTIAFGSADHCVHHYDLRNLKGPLGVFEGHKKAVSYVQFASRTELVSASTDGNLKLWDLNGQDCVRSFVGHVNDKNFVGLTTDGNYVACGSEDNSLYVYYKGIPSPILNYKFENYRSMILPARQEEVVCEFISAVAWRTGSPVIVAANSQGIIRVLELY